MLDQFSDLVRRARTRRRYVHADAISRETILQFIDLARVSPSGMNAQPLRYRVVTDAAEVAAVFPCTNWAKGLRTGPTPTPEERPSAWLVILSDKPPLDPGIDVGIAAQTIQLAATAAGYAACMLLSIDRLRLQEILHLPAGMKIELLMALGRAGEKVALEDIPASGATMYWRTPDQVHHVPKRKLSDVLI